MSHYDRRDRGRDRGGASDRGRRPMKLDCKVWVGELPHRADPRDLETVFGYYGPLKNVWVARNPPGFAFIEFEDPRDAKDAVRGEDGRTFKGRKIRVELSHGRSRQKKFEDRGRDDFRREDERGGRRRTRSRSRNRSRSGSRDRQRDRSEGDNGKIDDKEDGERKKSESPAPRERSGSPDKMANGNDEDDDRRSN